MPRNVTLFDLVGLSDNLHEPTPFINNRASFLSVVIVMQILSALSAFLRFFVRLRVLDAAGWDDVMLFLCLIFTSLGTTCICIMPFYGLGEHILLVDPDHIQAFLKLFYFASAFYITSAAFIKISLLFQYLRIYLSGKMRTLCITMAVLITLWGFTYSAIAWVPCVPISSYWSNMSTGVCYAYGSGDPVEFTRTFESHSATNMILDIIVYFIPMPLYFRKDTSSKVARAGLLCLHLLGFTVIVFASWRLQTIVEHRTSTYPTFDPTWYAPLSLAVSSIEIDLACVCASLPVFWPVLRKRLGNIFVMQEIKITHEDRVDKMELRHSRPASPVHTPQDCERGLRSGLRPELGQGLIQNQNRDGEKTKNCASTTVQHYQDKYIKERVDPLQKDTVGGPVVTIEAKEKKVRGRLTLSSSTSTKR